MARKNLTVENAHICFKNFSGKEGQFNPEGTRNFCLILDEDVAEQLKYEGWNVKYLSPRDPNELPRPYVQVAVSYRKIPPKVVLVTSRGKSILDETTVGMLDFAEIENIDLIVSPSHWEVNGQTGVKGYLKTMYVTLVEDIFESKYREQPDSAMAAIGGCGNCEECDGHCKGY